MIQKMVLSKILQVARFDGSKRLFAHAVSSTKGGHGGHTPNPELWRKVFYFMAVPAILASMLNTYLTEVEHAQHYKRPEVRPFEYLRIRNKKFPWGDGNHSLFHNPKINPLPKGYETDEEGNFLEPGTYAKK